MIDTLFDSNVALFSIPAIVGTIFFLFRVVLMVAGGAGDADVDTDIDVDMDMDVDVADADVDADLSDSTSAFNLLSIQSIAAFLMGFGWFGVAARLSFEQSMLVSVIAGLIGGGVMMWILAWLMKLIYSLQSSGTVSIRSAFGKEGHVYATIPARGTGRGQVRIVVHERSRIYNAVSDGPELATGARIKVISVNDDNSVTVMAVS